jgi:hypothetical protein
MRLHGLASNTLISADVVTSDGNFLTLASRRMRTYSGLCGAAVASSTTGHYPLSGPYAVRESAVSP